MNVFKSEEVSLNVRDMQVAFRTEGVAAELVSLLAAAEARAVEALESAKAKLMVEDTGLGSNKEVREAAVRVRLADLYKAVADAKVARHEAIAEYEKAHAEARFYRHLGTFLAAGANVAV